MSAFNHQSGEEYQNIFENAIEGIFQSSLDGCFLKVNPAMARIYGYDSPADMVSSIKSIENQIYVDAEDKEFFLNKLRVINQIEKFEVRNYKKDRDIIWVQVSAHIVKDDEGLPLFIEGFLADITSRKDAEMALRESEHRYRTLVEHLPGVVFLTSAENYEHMVYVSPNIVNILGYSPEEWTTVIQWADVIHPEEFEHIHTKKRRYDKIGEASQLEYRIRHRNGEYVWVKEEMSLVRDEQGLPMYRQSFLLDITNQKNTENAIHKSEEQFRKIFQANPIASCIATLSEGRFIAANDAYWKLSGFAPDEFLGRTSIELGFVNESERKSIVQRLEKEKSIHNEDGKLITRSREIRDTLEFFDLIIFDGQECILTMFYDITDKTNAQKALQDSEERFRLAFQTSPDAININRLEDGLYVDINDGFTTITGYTREDVIGKTSLEVDIWGDKNDRARLVNELKKKGFAKNLEAKFRLKNGMLETGLISASVLMLDDIPHIISITREIETIKQAEKTLHHQLQELTILHNVAVASSSSQNLDELLQRITDTVTDTLRPDNCGVELVTESGDAYRAHSSYRGISSEKLGGPVPLSKGVTGKVITTGKSIRLGEVTKEPVYLEITKGVRSELCVPINIRGKTIGAINIESKNLNAYTETDERLLNTIAGTLSTAIEKLRLFETETIRRKQAEILLNATTTLTSSLDMGTLFETILEILPKIVLHDSASIAIEQQDGNLVIVAGRGFPPGYEVIGKEIGHSEKWLLMNATRKAYIVPDVQQEETFEKWEGSEYIRGWMGVPMYSHDKLLGFINLDSRIPNAFTEQDAILVQTFANSAAVAIENGHLFEIEQENRERAERLREATAALTASLDLEELYDIVLDSFSTLIPFDSMSIELANQGYLEVVAGKWKKNYKVAIGARYPYLTENWGSFDALQDPIIMPDAQEDKRFEKLEGTEHIHGWMGVPMTIHDKVIGFLNFDSTSRDFFTKDHANVAQIFGHQVAVAIENARLFESEQRRHRESETLRQAALAITTSLELESVLETILMVMKHVLPYDSSSVILLERDELQVKAAQGFDKKENITSLRFPETDELFSVVRKNKEPLILDNVRKDTRFKNYGNTHHICGWMGVPLTLRDEVIGYITFDSRKEGAYNQSDAVLAQSFANQAASAIQNARQFETEQRHFQEAENLRQAAEAVTSSLDIQQVLSAILENINRVVPFDSASVFMLENDKVRLTAIKGIVNQTGSIDQVFAADNPLLQEILQTRLPVILENASADHRIESWLVNQTHGWMGIPLVTHGNIIGYITLDSKKIGAYKNHDANLAMTFAHQAAVAIENAHLYKRSEQQIRRLTVLRDIDNAISSSFDLRVTLDLLVNHTIKELNVDAATILLYDPDLHSLSVFASTGITENRNRSAMSIRIGEGFAGNVALQRKMVHIPDISKEENGAHNIPYIQQNFTGYFGIPLIGKGQIKGVLEVYTREKYYPTSNWTDFLHTLAGQAAIAIDNAQLFRHLQRSNQELTLAYDTTLAGWGRALELRDKETQGHTNRVVKLTLELAQRLGVEGEHLTHIMRGTLLHDIGKMGVPDSILHKPGKLTEEEWEIMRQHPQHAYDLINPIPYLRPSMDIPYAHHEHWDGNGYPQGLKGEEIPLAARIFAVVDVWDALLFDRPYREAWPEEKVIEQIKKESGTKLDPTIAKEFLKMVRENPFQQK